MDGQCGLTINYSYVVGPCDTVLHNINILSITGSTCTSFSLLWDNATTAMATQLDTGYHYLYISDCFGCATIDTFLIACVGWDGTTNIANFQNQGKFTILPNPATDIIDIKSNKQSIEAVFIYNVSGRLIKEIKNLYKDDLSINIADFEKGMYFLKIKNSNGISIMKFVKT